MFRAASAAREWIPRGGPGLRKEQPNGGRAVAYAEKRGKGPRPWRVKYKVPGGEASESGFETKQAALVWGQDQEVRA
jgi:hypothetical protein